MQRLTLSVPEAARVLGVSVATAWNMAWSGALPTVRLGRRVLVPVGVLAEMARVSVAEVLDAVRSEPDGRQEGGGDDA